MLAGLIDQNPTAPAGSRRIEATAAKLFGTEYGAVGNRQVQLHSLDQFGDSIGGERFGTMPADRQRSSPDEIGASPVGDPGFRRDDGLG